ncbi:MAG: ATP-binding cassette domain-containing protein [Pseudomonadota bacterium]
MSALLELRGARLGRRRLLRAPCVLLSQIDLALSAGEIVALTGEIGPAATCLAGLMTGQAPPLAGTVLFEGTDLGRLPGHQWRRLRWRMAIWRSAAEAPLSPLSPAMAALEEQLDTLLPRLDPRHRAPRLLEALERAGVAPERALDQPASLSPNDRAALSLARALVTRPELLLAIDPFAQLDPSERASTLNRLLRMAGEGVAILLLTPDIGLAGHVAQRLGVLRAGRLVEYGMAEDLMLTPRHPYTQLLLNTRADPLGGNWSHPRPPAPLPPAEPVFLRPLRAPRVPADLVAEESPEAGAPAEEITEENAAENAEEPAGQASAASSSTETERTT